MTDFGQEQPAGLRVFDVLARSRWRWVLAALAVAVAGLAIYQRFVIDPKLTATELEVWIAGDPDRVTIYVDPDAQVTAVVESQGALSQFTLSEDSLLVLSTEVAAATTATWVAVPLDRLDPSFRALEPRRLLSSLWPGEVRCETPDDDASIVLTLTVGEDLAASEGTSLCGSSVGAAADRGEDVLVARLAVEPPNEPPVPVDSVVALDDLSNADEVSTRLDSLVVWED